MTDYKSRQYLRNRFSKLNKPKEVDFHDWLNAFVHRDDEWIRLKDIESSETTIGLYASDDGGKLTLGIETDPKVSLVGRQGRLFLGGTDFDSASISLASEYSRLLLGSSNYTGNIQIKDTSGDIKALLDGQEGILTLGGENFDNAPIAFHGDKGSLYLGSQDISGSLKMKDSNNNLTIVLDGKNGEIQAKISGVGSIPDFIFDTDYKLLPLEDLNKKIKKGRHLPGIPSAREIKENGLNLTDFSMKLLQKIEELTLYIIDLQNQVNELKSKQ